MHVWHMPARVVRTDLSGPFINDWSMSFLAVLRQFTDHSGKTSKELCSNYSNMHDHMQIQ